MAHVQAAAAMEAAHEQQLASHSGLLDSALDVTATVEARFGLQTNPSLILYQPAKYDDDSRCTAYAGNLVLQKMEDEAKAAAAAAAEAETEAEAAAREAAALREEATRLKAEAEAEAETPNYGGCEMA